MPNIAEPSWLTVAKRFDGLAEIKGPHNNTAIMDLLDLADGKDDSKFVGAPNDDEAWCSKFVSAVLELDGTHSTRSAWARSYVNWGVKLDGPAVGAIAVLERGPTMGHVTFVLGRDGAGNFIGEGGNQGDMVKASPFDPKRVLGWRWPPGRPLPAAIGFASLPLLRLRDNRFVSET